MTTPDTNTATMTKAEALAALGGTPTTAARAIGVTPQAVIQWPEVLSPAVRDRVQAALWRAERSKARGSKAKPATNSTTPTATIDVAA